ncbi:prolipoprotein diacylglyceryl transferase [Flaviflagellibacter deserti]|uniref:Phosphatidylglycerol--prolipoprotein diacylglyceryl transferase n=1 Tax=Flaviflagellibacter deserti TaxID=2267266 RepID=A0ABV9YZB5_9HYPH
MPPIAIPFPEIDPIAFAIGPFAVRWYALAYVLGLLLGWWLCRRLIRAPQLWGRKPPLDDAGLDDFLVYIAVGVVLGGRLGYVLFYNLSYYIEHPTEAFRVWEGGMSFHGGLLGTILAMWVMARRRGIDVRELFDLAAAVVPIGLFFGRIANFVNGELWGRVTDVPWAMVFPNAGPDPRHPSQIYQAGLEGIVLFVVMMTLVRKGGLKRPGLAGGVFLIGYGIARIIGEFFRQPDVQIGFLAGGLTMGMILSLPMILVGIALVATAREPAKA